VASSARSDQGAEREGQAAAFVVAALIRRVFLASQAPIL
jgi:hypothetical protein